MPGDVAGPSKIIYKTHLTAEWDLLIAAFVPTFATFGFTLFEGTWPRALRDHAPCYFLVHVLNPAR